MGCGDWLGESNARVGRAFVRRQAARQGQRNLRGTELLPHLQRAAVDRARRSERETQGPPISSVAMPPNTSALPRDGSFSG